MLTAKRWNMRLSYSNIIFIIQTITLLQGQDLAPNNYSLNKVSSDSSFQNGLVSNTIAEIRLMGDSLTWFGTGQGLSLYNGEKVYSHISTQDSMTDRSSTNILPYGGIPAIAVLDNTDTMAVAFSGDNGVIQVGHGLALTFNAIDSGGIDWLYLQQPTDQGEEDSILHFFGEGSFYGLPVTVPEANVTYDASLTKEYLWTASWAGGLRRYNLDLDIWEVIPLPMDNQDSLSLCEGFLPPDNQDRKILPNYFLNPRDPPQGNHNHKAFSILVFEDTLWVGTANGINKGVIIDEWVSDSDGDGLPEKLNCIRWVHYSYPNHNLSGNFVVDIERQAWNNTIWAATVNADSPGELRGLSYTKDGGLTWSNTLLGERVYNIFTKDSLIFASSQSGLWKSFDGVNWAVYDSPVDTTFMSQGQILSDVVYTSVIDDRDGVMNLWVGTPNGVAYSNNLQGSSWNVFQTEYDTLDFYAYPNPFSPMNHNQLDGDGYVRFHTGKIANTQIELDIFNFAMEKVYKRAFDLVSYNGALKWNGRDLNNNLVDNGVYFIRMKYSPSLYQNPSYHWDKLIVIK